MTCSKLKIVSCLTVCLTVLFAPLLLEIFQDGKTYAFSSRSNNKGSKGTGEFSAPGYTPVDQEPTDNNTAPAPIPEPATWLLLGAGAAGVAAFRKKFKKK